MEKETILDRLDGPQKIGHDEGIGALWQRDRSTSRQAEAVAGPWANLPGAPIPSRPDCVAPAQPVKDAAAPRWFPFPPTQNGTEPIFYPQITQIFADYFILNL